ncbi:nucleolar protein 14 homolog l(3)07882 [Lycorma delicatula]|uniref:nucleolar protein 14 homolog l(3)07882 n=1 Tax=Lycorma delicatula TaxID=130591 RepID=UPI003F512DF6
MAKSKFRKKNLSETLIKKTGKTKNVNPFEIRVNKQKFDVLGRKSKNDRGLPGIARAKSIKKRKETLLQEYKVKDKVNKFLDRRIGENNAAMTQEDRVMARFTAERIKAHNKKTMFNLADEEVLTHRGKTLSEIEKYDDPGTDEEEEFGGRSGGLDADIVDAHFGGEIFREKGDGAKTHASLIDELIAESKKRKAERQRAKEQTLELTDKLDADWQELLPLVGSGKGPEDVEQRPEKGSYDQLMRELKFESRGMPSDRLKGENEIAREEKDRLEKLEAERLRRMKGLESDSIPAPKHRSADDLDDGFEIESEIDETETTGSNELNEIKSEDATVGDSEGEEEDNSDDDDDDDDNNSSNNYSGKAVEKEKKVNESDNSKRICDSKRDDDKDTDRNSEDEDEDEDNDDLSDLKHCSDDYGDVDNDLNNDVKGEFVELKSKEHRETVIIHSDKLNSDKFMDALMKKKQLMEEARQKLPYTFKLPESYEELESVMEGYGVDHQGVIVERMIKCNHPSLGENNKKKLEELFAFLLQLLNDADDKVVWKLLDRLAPHFFDLTQFSPENSARCLLEVLREKHEDFKNYPHRFPEVDTLVFLKLVSLLFPTSDARHQVTTPAFVFLVQILNQCRVNGRKAISMGLFVVTLILEYSSLSKRYSPEVFNFLQGILEMAVPDEKVSLPYCKAGYHPLILKSSYVNRSDENGRLSLCTLSEEDVSVDDSFRINALFTVIRLLAIACNQFEHIPSFKIIFGPINKLLNKLEHSKYPTTLRDEINNLQTALSKVFSQKVDYVVLEKKKPKALRLYEPLIEKVVEGKKKRDIPEEKAEQQKLLTKYKREMKGALREIRRDNAFLSKVKLKNQARSDEERKTKVKQIYSWGAAQEGEFNKLKRRKKH